MLTAGMGLCCILPLDSFSPADGDGSDHWHTDNTTAMKHVKMFILMLATFICIYMSANFDSVSTVGTTKNRMWALSTVLTLITIFYAKGSYIKS